MFCNQYSHQILAKAQDTFPLVDAGGKTFMFEYEILNGSQQMQWGLWQVLWLEEDVRMLIKQLSDNEIALEGFLTRGVL